jgi:hypothetical protein
MSPENGFPALQLVTVPLDLMVLTAPLLAVAGIWWRRRRHCSVVEPSVALLGWIAALGGGALYFLSGWRYGAGSSDSPEDVLAATLVLAVMALPWALALHSLMSDGAGDA